MTSLSSSLRKRANLSSAWAKVRENGRAIGASERTRLEVERFEQEKDRALDRLQRQLRSNRFMFGAQRGNVIPKSQPGKFRGIIGSPIENRIVQRAILQVLQSKVADVRNVLDTRTSVGGIPKRGSGHALALIRDAYRSGCTHFVRSDIPQFFNAIPRDNVMAFFEGCITEPDFLELLDKAIEVNLENEATLGEHRNLFPVGPTGIAQGSPLSALIGNIVLREFDRELNVNGVVCVRYIDDFVLLASTERQAARAFRLAASLLRKLKLSAYSPDSDPKKASKGTIATGFEFLGYEVRGASFSPSRKARKNLFAKVEQILAEARHQMKVQTSSRSTTQKSPLATSYVSALHRVNLTIRGWSHSFSHADDTVSLHQLDQRISTLIEEFQSEYVRMSASLASHEDRRRALGIALLTDVPRKGLPSLASQAEMSS